MRVTVSVRPVPHKGETLDEPDLGQARLRPEIMFSGPEDASGND
jgi:hypothetical protein